MARPMYLLGLTFLVTTFPPQIYLTLSLRNLGFDVFQTNLLTIPSQILGSKLSSRELFLSSRAFVRTANTFTISGDNVALGLARRKVQAAAWVGGARASLGSPVFDMASSRIRRRVIKVDDLGGSDASPGQAYEYVPPILQLMCLVICSVPAVGC